MAIKEGDKAPDIKTPAFKLAAQRGKRVVLFFYPKSDTPGCTTEACEFRDSMKAMEQKGAIIVGVSPDQAPAQEKFAAKYNLPFILVPDPEHAIAEVYEVWTEKSMYGRKYMGIERSTFVVDEKGKIAHVFRKVKPAGHAAQVLEALAR